MRTTHFTSTVLPALVLCLVASLLAAMPAQAQFQRTIVVGGQPTPQANGSALLTALANITTNSATNPWLIRLEPGIFDLQGSNLTLKDYVDLEGSGRDVTYVRSTSTFAFPPGTGATVDVPAGVNAEVRNLTVQSFAAGTAIPVANQSDFFLLTQVNLESDSPGAARGFWTTNSAPRVSEVFARVSSTGGNATGVLIIGGAPVLSEVFVLADASNSTRGYKVEDGAFATLLEVRAQVGDGASNNFGLLVNPSSAVTVQNCNLWAQGGSAQTTENFAVNLKNGAQATIKDCILRADGGLTTVGLSNHGGVAVVRESSLAATGGASSTDGARNSGGATTRLDRCTVEGDTASVTTSSAADSATLGASQLIGPVSAAAGSLLVCAQSYDGNYVELNPFCL